MDPDPFTYRATKSGKVLIGRGGRQVSVLAGNPAAKLLSKLETAGSEEERQLLLARATGNYRRGNER